jgi:hypothetical protein
MNRVFAGTVFFVAIVLEPVRADSGDERPVGSGGSPSATEAKESSSESAAEWKTIFTLDQGPKKDKWFAGLWASETGDLFAVGRETIVHCFRDGACTVQDLPEHYCPMAVWGPSPTDVFAVGWLGLILHYDGKDWKVENPMGPKSFARQRLLNRVGPFLPDAIVAGGSTHGEIKRVDGKWVPLTKEWSRDRDLVVENPDDGKRWRSSGVLFDSAGLVFDEGPENRGPCKTSGLDSWRRDKAGSLWVMCQDRSAFWQQGETWVPGGRAPKVCSLVGSTEYWNGSVFLSFDKWRGKEQLWRTQNGQWYREHTPAVIRDFSGTSTALYAVTDRLIIKRSR